ncbi:MAG TPA: ribonuclease HI family protein [Candidatus Binatia bacterium]|jgi:ribonuclease HI|nr:ribonuclease HI family protein [Candidatus Binatia bacterium]
MKLIIHTDGGARGNPGPSGLGVYITGADGEVLKAHSRYLGHQTNNYAEYMAIIDALTHAKELGADEVDMRMDSELAVKQLNGEYRVRNAALGLLFVQVHNLKLGFRKVTFTHVRREMNKQADKLVNEAIDRHLRGQ